MLGRCYQIAGRLATSGINRGKHPSTFTGGYFCCCRPNLEWADDQCKRLHITTVTVWMLWTQQVVCVTIYGKPRQGRFFHMVQLPCAG